LNAPNGQTPEPEKPAVLSQSDCIEPKHPFNIAQLTSRGDSIFKTEESMAERVKRVIELMEGDPSRSFTLGKMAESVNLSAPYFCYLFKTITGVPPAKYLKSLRMQQAGTLLTTTFLSVKEIVRRVGLTDESHFVRDFKRVYGMTPSEYRNSALLSSEHRNIERPNPPMNKKIGQ
jgi:AraC-like DNA-binding protein